MSEQPLTAIDLANYPIRVVVDEHGHYWRDYGDHWSMCPVSEENIATEPVFSFYREDDPALEAAEQDVRRHIARIIELEAELDAARAGVPGDEGLRAALDDPERFGWKGLPQYAIAYAAAIRDVKAFIAADPSLFDDGTLREFRLDFVAQARHIIAEHEATHGEAEMCGGECIVLGLTEFDDAASPAPAGLDVERLAIALDSTPTLVSWRVDKGDRFEAVQTWAADIAREYAALASPDSERPA